MPKTVCDAPKTVGKAPKILFLAGFLAFWNVFLADYRCRNFWKACKHGICKGFLNMPKILFLAGNILFIKPYEKPFVGLIMKQFFNCKEIE